jgi:cell division protein FtsB
MAGVRVRRWVIYGAGAVLVAGLSAATPGGLRTYLDLRSDVERMRAENARLAAENRQHSLEVHALKSDPDAVERAIREELRYIRPGERVYVLEEPKPGGGP